MCPSPMPTATSVWLPRWLAGWVLVVGLLAMGVRAAPVTWWAVPWSTGPLVDDWVVWQIKRSDTAVRVDVGPSDSQRGHRTVRLVAADVASGTPWLRTERVHAVLEPGDGPPPPDRVALALKLKLDAWEASWPPRPAFVASRAHVMSTMQTLEARVLDGVLLAWLVGMVASFAAWRRAYADVAWPTWAAVSGLVVAQASWVRWWGIGGVWHSNNHGFERLADVHLGTPPASASLGLLHGYGYYTVFHPLHALTGASVFTLAQGVSAALLVGTFVWLRAVFGTDRPALWGTAWMACVPALVRLSASESMYIPTVWWVVMTLAAFEHYLRSDRARWWWLGLASAFLAMQTRAEMMLLVPLWLALVMLYRRPTWVRSAYRRPHVWTGLAVAALAFAPRLSALVTTPVPSELRRAGLNPVSDPRLALVIALGLVCLWAVPGPVGGALRRLTSGRRAFVAAAVVAVLGLLTWLDAVRPVPGPAERLWQVHVLFEPSVTPWWLAAIVVGGVVQGVARKEVAVALLAWAVATWVYLPQIDCLSTFVRTGLATLPWLALIAGSALDAWLVRLGQRVGAVVVGAVLAGALFASLPWLTFRYPKQLRQDAWLSFVDQVGPRDVVVAMLPEDVPATWTSRGVRVTVPKVDRELGGGRRVMGIEAWKRGEAQGADQVWFFEDLSCHRPMLGRAGLVYLGDEATAQWAYEDVSRIATEGRIRWQGVPPDWLHPLCREALVAAKSVTPPLALPDRVAGSIYETLLGSHPQVGWYALPAVPLR